MNQAPFQTLRPDIRGVLSPIGRAAARWRTSFQNKFLILTGFGVLTTMLIAVIVGAYGLTKTADRAAAEMRDKAERTAGSVLDNLSEIAAKRLDETINQAMAEAETGAMVVQHFIDHRKQLKPLNDFLSTFPTTADRANYTPPYTEEPGTPTLIAIPAKQWSAAQATDNIEVTLTHKVDPLPKEGAGVLAFRQGETLVEVTNWTWENSKITIPTTETTAPGILKLDPAQALSLKRYQHYSYGNWIQTTDQKSPTTVSIYGNMVENPPRPNATNLFPGPDGTLVGVNAISDQTLDETRFLKLILEPIRKAGLVKPQVYFQGGKNAGFFRNSPWVDVVKNTETAYPGGNNQETWSFFWNGLQESWTDQYQDALARMAADPKLTMDDALSGPNRIQTVIQPYEDAFNPGHYVMSVYQPIWDHAEKRVYGIFGVDVTFDTFIDIVEGLKVGNNGFAFLLRKDAKRVLAGKREGLEILGFGEGFKKSNKTGSVTGLELKLADSTSPEVASLLENLPANFASGQAASKKINYLGKEYIITLKAMTPFKFWDFSPPLKRETWIVGTVASADELLAAVAQGQSQFKSATRTLLVSQSVVVAVCAVLLLSLLLTVFHSEAAGIVTLSKAVSAISKKNYQVRVEVPHQDEIGHLAEGINFMAGQILEHTENLERRVAERTTELKSANAAITELNEKLKDENLRMGAELDITRKLQIMALPTDLELRDKHPALDLAGYMQPAERVGGDLYEALRSESRLLFAVGDVTDHGLESGVVMLQTMAASRALFDAGRDVEEMRHPKHYLSVLNRTVYGLTKRLDNDKNLTYAIIDYRLAENGAILTVCGQHEELLVCRVDGSIERYDTQDLGFPIGIIDDISDLINMLEIPIHSGDIVLLYTDGVTEAENPGEELYGCDRLIDSLHQHYRLPTAAEIRGALIGDLNSFIGGATIQDDISLLVIKQR